MSSNIQTPNSLLAYRPTGQSTDVTLQIAKRAAANRDATATAEKIKRTGFEYLADPYTFVTGTIRTNQRPTILTEEQIVAQNCALHLIRVLKVTPECVAAFEEVANSCYEIPFNGVIGFDSLDEFLANKEFEHFKNQLGDYGTQMLSMLVDKYTFKPFGPYGMIEFLNEHIHLFHWLNGSNAASVSADALVKISLFHQSYRRKVENDTFNARLIYLGKWFEQHVEKIGDIHHPVGDGQVISKKQLLRLIEIAGKSRNCFDFYLPYLPDGDPTYHHALESWGFTPKGESCSRYNRKVIPLTNFQTSFQ